MWTDICTKPKLGLLYHKFWGHVMGIPTDCNDKDYNGIIPSIPPVNLMVAEPKAQKELHECVGDNQKETILTNLQKDATYSLPSGSILARKSYLRTLADPAEILLEPTLTNNEDGQNWKCKHVPGKSALPTLSGLKRLRKKIMVWVLIIKKL
jgi:hypothetical protein